jgi:DNA-binding LacI/PurR family transcriptional regulator
VRPRLKHIAERAGVSQATVSRVLNDRPGVGEATRRSVVRALRELGYEPVGGARTRRRSLVGLIVPELDNPVFPRFAQALESELAGEGRTTVLCTSTPAGMSEADYLETLVEQGASGVVLVSGEHADTSLDHTRYLDLLRAGTPAVVVNGRPADLAVPSVTVDHVAAGQQAVAHLASLGHRRIGLAVGPERFVPSQELTEGYRRGLVGAGLPAPADLVAATLYGIEGGRSAGAALLAAGATAVVCASDLVALGVVHAVRDAGRSVPRDVSVVGFDDAGPNAYLDPPLTSVRQPFEAMAAAAVRLLLAVEAPAGPTPELRFLPELIARASTGPVASG